MIQHYKKGNGYIWRGQKPKFGMTKNLEDRKYRIIQELIKTEDEALIADLENRLAQGREEAPPDQVWSSAIKPMRETISVEELASEQNYTPLQRDEFFDLTAALDIQEDIEELLAQL